MNIRVVQGKGQAQKTDLLVVPVMETTQPSSPLLNSCNKELNGFLKRILAEEGFTGKTGEKKIIYTHGLIPAHRILVIGVGKKEKCTVEQVRRLGGHVAGAARSIHTTRVAISLEELMHAGTPQAVAQACAEGASLASYQFLKYKKSAAEEAKKIDIKELLMVDPTAARVRSMTAGVERARIYTAGSIFVRDLVNEPAMHMTPKHLADAALALNKIPGVKVTVYDESQIRKMKMGSFLSVSAGSDEQAYLIHLAYTPRKKRKTIALCGKGITFDSGGLSIKPANYMHGMKSDMAGAATIMGLFSQLGTIKPSVAIHGVIAATENMPSGKATRPGDVVTAYNGKTIEITNTDAEGRLVLADALAWAEKQFAPDYMIDLATLTGAQIVALGQEVAAMMGTDKKLLAAYQAAANEAGEPVWELPLIEEYADLLKSPIADLQNLSKSIWAGAILGGMFLQQFVEKTPWMHIDIAGPSWIEQQILPYNPFGASGYGVRTLLNLVQKL